jgi:hypothetical protein
MASRDIVNQMTEEMGMNQQMLQSMQSQQMGAPLDFNQMNPEQQQMMMMQQAAPQQQSQQYPPSQDYDDSSSVSSSSGSVEMDLDKLGLNVSHNKGFFDNFFYYLRDPLIVVVLCVIFGLTQVDNILKPLLPYGFSYGMYFISFKALLVGALFFAIKLVL